MAEEGRRKKCLAVALPSKLDETRRVAMDFVGAVQFIEQKEDYISGRIDAAVEAQGNDQKMRDIALVASAIFRDSVARGMIVSSEMQVAKSNMIERIDEYMAFLQAHDHGNRDESLRSLKQNSAGETSRSVAGVVWEVSDCDKIKQGASCFACTIDGLSVDKKARGNIATIVPVKKTPREIFNTEDDAFREEVENLMLEMDSRVDEYFNSVGSKIGDMTRRLVKEVANVISFSHLMWPELVDGFCDQVQEMCKRLKITEGNIMKVKDSEYIRDLVGKFEELEHEKAKAGELQRQKDELLKQYDIISAENTSADAKLARIEELMAKLTRAPVGERTAAQEGAGNNSSREIVRESIIELQEGTEAMTETE
jgi:hypothetical protein